MRIEHQLISEGWLFDGANSYSLSMTIILSLNVVRVSVLFIIPSLFGFPLLLVAINARHPAPAHSCFQERSPKVEASLVSASKCARLFGFVPVLFFPSPYSERAVFLCFVSHLLTVA